MTAIAWKDGILASDSREMFDDGVISNDANKKIYKTKNFVLGASGDSAICSWFYAWVLSDFTIKTMPHDNDKESYALLVDRKEKKLYCCYPNGTKEELNPKVPHCIGSASHLVRPFMIELKCSAMQAIKKAAKYDTTINNLVQKVKCW